MPGYTLSLKPTAPRKAPVAFGTFGLLNSWHTVPTLWTVKTEALEGGRLAQLTARRLPAPLSWTLGKAALNEQEATRPPSATL